MLIQARRPVIINGISLAPDAGDLLSRVISLNLQPADKRLGETEFRVECERVRPLILGVIYDAVRAALKSWRSIELMKAPRLVDMAKRMIGKAMQPKLQIVTERIRALGMQFGGEELLKQTIAELVKVVQGGPAANP